MNIYVGITDNGWFKFLASNKPDEVNFWRPGGTQSFRVLQPGEPFLFKLHSPYDFVVGGGFFVRHTVLPVSLAWDAFGQKNGASGLSVLQDMIARFRHDKHPDPPIGCTILTQPFFLPQKKWIPIPPDWSKNLVTGKRYCTEDVVGARLWAEVQSRLFLEESHKTTGVVSEEPAPQYGKEFLTKARLGQGAFRVLVTEAYRRRCAITGERTLPVLQASHIKPFAKQGPNLVRNGLLLRSDIHTLYDQGYLTVTRDYRVEVSKRIREEFENGRIYYALHGQVLAVMPDDPDDRPSQQFLEWHNEQVYVA
jgi:putative restriction endonuclease